MRERGFSLLEIMMACSILALLMGLSALQMRSGARRASSQALARLLQEECNSARLTAMASGTPTGLSLTKAPASQGLYVLQGVAAARVIRNLRFDGEYPRAAFTSAPWDTSEWTWESPPASATWSRPENCGPTLIFFPNGQVSGLDWPRSPRGYHLVIGSDLAVAGERLQQAHEPYTLTVDRLGTVTLEAGVPAARLGSAIPSAVGIPIASPETANNDPKVLPEDIQIYPVPNPDTLPPGMSALLDKETYLILDLYASDADGDPLTGRWEASGGVFSDGVPDQPLQYRPGQEKGKSTVAWAPPVDARAGDVFFLKCSLEDKRGGKFVATKTVLGNLAAAVRSRGHLCTSTDSKVFILDGDGTHLRELPLPVPADQVSLDPTGRTLLMDFEGKLYTMSNDGTGFEQVEGVSEASHGELSAYGHLVYAKKNPASGRTDLHRCALDGTMDVRLTNTAASSSAIQPRWSSDGSRIAFTRLVNGNPALPEVHLMDEAGESAGRNRAVGRGWSPCFDPTGQRIAFLRPDGIYRLRLNDPGERPVQILARSFNFSYSRQLSWSNWGNTLLFVEGNWSQPDYANSQGTLSYLQLGGAGTVQKALTGPIRSATWTW